MTPIKLDHLTLLDNVGKYIKVKFKNVEMMMSMKLHKAVFSSLLIATTSFVLSACTPEYVTRGNKPTEERLAEIVPHEVNARDVAEILGTPSTFSAFNGETWYYINEKVEYYSFLEPKIIHREVVAVHFDKEGLVDTVQVEENQNLSKLKFVERQTPTAGNELSFFEQIFGNLGRFEQ